MELRGKRYDDGRPVSVEIARGRVLHVRELRENLEQTAELPWLAPALMDIQVNGHGGVEFSSESLTPEQVAHVVRKLFAHGVARICPTLTTQSDATFRHSISTILGACRRFPDVDAAVVGIHLEGPYLSAEDGPRGAHPPEHCRPPQWEEFARWFELASGRISIVTLSCEYESAPVFIEKAATAGIVVALGHMSATGEQIRAAVDAGARLSTHLGNGAHRLLPRHPNYLWHQLAEDRLMASLIADGHHLPPEVLRTFVRAKGPGRCILISDLSGLAGLAPGIHRWSGGSLEILEDGKIVIAGQRALLAGASRTVEAGIPQVMACTGVSLGEAVDMATVQPANLLGVRGGGFRPGDWADFTLFHMRPGTSGSPLVSLEVVATYLRGMQVYPRADAGQ